MKKFRDFIFGTRESGSERIAGWIIWTIAFTVAYVTTPKGLTLANFLIFVAIILVIEIILALVYVVASEKFRKK